MTRILHLETSTKACSVALSENGQLIAMKESLTDDFSHSENLTNYIQDLLEGQQLSTKDLSAISVASGPGSYTGLRIGVSTAKGLCYALGIPLIAVDSLLSLATLACTKHKGVNLCMAIDARRMEIFSGIYNTETTLLKSISADIVDEHSYTEYEPFLVAGDSNEKLKQLWAHRNITFDDEIHCSAAGQINEATRKFQAGEVEDVAYFEPFYLKDFVTVQPKKIN
jgi:tRNA threonylcarbamoyladenosine biosynthesis protein TsaB